AHDHTPHPFPTRRSSDLLEENQRDAALRAQLYEVSTLLRRLREQDAVVADDPHRVAPDAGEAADQCLAVERLELVELAAVDDPRDDFARVVGLLQVRRDDPV